MVHLVEASISDLRQALTRGETTAVQLVQAYLDRLDAYDRPGTALALNSMAVMNPDALLEAKASDERRARGSVLSPLDGIPYTAKDSYLVAGLTAAAGSPAFKALQARRDAFTIASLRSAGAICLGKTNMPPMANGGMQRGLYGRAESPYNADYLTAPFASGSSNGAGTATAASFAAFGLAEETWSSGRGPASNNGLCAYTPSRGVISVRGNWPLTPTMDVVVPYARTMADLFEILDVIVADDDEVRGDLWRWQPWIPIPRASQVRPASYPALAASGKALAGLRLGVPRMYINADPDAGTGPRPGIGGPAGERIVTRQSVMDLWAEARRDLERAGAEVVEVDFPVISNYEGDRLECPTIFSRGLVSPDFIEREMWDLTAWAFDDFLRANGDSALCRLADAHGPDIYPHDPGTLPNRDGDLVVSMKRYVTIAKMGLVAWEDIPGLEDGLRGLEQTRVIDFENWMERQGLDAVVFPAVADVGPADADIDEDAADCAWRNGVWVANGNLAIRHLGIPTVTVPMGLLADIGMPVGLTFAGHSYADNMLLRIAAAFETLRPRRQAPARTPEIAPR